MNKFKRKFIIGFIFAFTASLVSVGVKYYADFFTGIVEHIESIGVNFLIFFLLGYVVLGNILINKKTN